MTEKNQHFSWRYLLSHRFSGLPNNAHGSKVLMNEWKKDAASTRRLNFHKTKEKIFHCSATKHLIGIDCFCTVSVLFRPSSSSVFLSFFLSFSRRLTLFLFGFFFCFAPAHSFKPSSPRAHRLLSNSTFFSFTALLIHFSRSPFASLMIWALFAVLVYDYYYFSLIFVLFLSELRTS